MRQKTNLLIQHVMNSIGYWLGNRWSAARLAVNWPAGQSLRQIYAEHSHISRLLEHAAWLRLDNSRGRPPPAQVAVLPIRGCRQLCVKCFISLLSSVCRTRLQPATLASTGRAGISLIRWLTSLNVPRLFILKDALLLHFCNTLSCVAHTTVQICEVTNQWFLSQHSHIFLLSSSPCSCGKLRNLSPFQCLLYLFHNKLWRLAVNSAFEALFILP